MGASLWLAILFLFKRERNRVQPVPRLAQKGCRAGSEYKTQKKHHLTKQNTTQARDSLT